MRERLISPNFDFFSRPQSTQRFFHFKLFPPRPRRLRGELSKGRGLEKRNPPQRHRVRRDFFISNSSLPVLGVSSVNYLKDAGIEKRNRQHRHRTSRDSCISYTSFSAPHVSAQN